MVPFLWFLVLLDGLAEGLAEESQQRASVSKSFAYGSGTREATPGHRTFFLIQARDNSGSNISIGGAAFSASLSLKEQEYTQPVIKDLENGQYEGSFQVNQTGAYQLYIALGNERIEESYTVVAASGYESSSSYSSSSYSSSSYSSSSYSHSSHESSSRGSSGLNTPVISVTTDTSLGRLIVTSVISGLAFLLLILLLCFCIGAMIKSCRKNDELVDDSDFNIKAQEQRWDLHDYDLILPEEKVHKDLRHKMKKPGEGSESIRLTSRPVPQGQGSGYGSTEIPASMPLLLDPSIQISSRSKPQPVRIPPSTVIKDKRHHRAQSAIPEECDSANSRSSSPPPPPPLPDYGDFEALPPLEQPDSTEIGEQRQNVELSSPPRELGEVHRPKELLSASRKNVDEVQKSKSIEPLSARKSALRVKGISPLPSQSGAKKESRSVTFSKPVLPPPPALELRDESSDEDIPPPPLDTLASEDLLIRIPENEQSPLSMASPGQPGTFSMGKFDSWGEPEKDKSDSVQSPVIIDPFPDDPVPEQTPVVKKSTRATPLPIDESDRFYVPISNQSTRTGSTGSTGSRGLDARSYILSQNRHDIGRK